MRDHEFLRLGIRETGKGVFYSFLRSPSQGTFSIRQQDYTGSKLDPSAQED